MGRETDPDWAEHDGYPRDMSEQEQAQHEQRKIAMRRAERMGSSIIDISRFGNIRTTVFEGEYAMEVGDPVALRGQDGKVRKAKLGEQYVGFVEAVDPASGLVTVRMR